ncbi:MAG: UDP-N-acetylmuramyl-tripeptide synthetase [Deltaproteobacteria bacterium]|nr:UDP-N-acetylmuramyl-tripeptide synthetase [Deltaproteobacteria bacterium]
MSSPGRPVPAAFAWAEPLFTYGVTGTNGKTSTCALIRACLRADGRHVLTVGTTGAFIDEQQVPKGKTFADFAALIERGKDAGCRDVVVETTSYGLKIGYARKWRFDLGVFTNLSPDHLKTHGTWEDYLAAKAQLFLHLGPGQPMVLNAADQYAGFIDQATPKDVRRLWFRVPSRGPAVVTPDLEAASVTVDCGGTTIALAPSALADALGGTLAVKMVGEVFAENALAAAAACLSAGVPPQAVVRGLAECPGVPGRFEVLARDPTVVVDYAHTPDALQRTCDTARAVATGAVIVVFGAGGGATPQKRGPMGEAVARGADRMVITADNPRREDPTAIANTIAQGARTVDGGAQVEIIVERRAAIEHAIAHATAGDVVVIAGMGHERTQRIGDTDVPFSDRDEVLRITGGG